MAVLSFRASIYATNIYLHGNYSLTSIPTEYYIPVEIYAMTGKVNGVNYPANFTGFGLAQIQDALANGYITQTQYDETIAYNV
jgi:hypothetical protein